MRNNSVVISLREMKLSGPYLAERDGYNKGETIVSRQLNRYIASYSPIRPWHPSSSFLQEFSHD